MKLHTRLLAILATSAFLIFYSLMASDEDVVPNSETAIKVAEGVLFPMYGEEKIKAEKPYKVELKDGVWTIQGSVPSGHKGGAFFVQISKRTGQTIRVTHFK
jgi:hypothetical protein